MGIDVRPEMLVHRPRPDVAAFMFDHANDLAWTGGITASRPAQPGPLVTGATVERTARFLGRTFTYGYAVTAHEPDRVGEVREHRFGAGRDVHAHLDDVPRPFSVATVHDRTSVCSVVRCSASASSFSWFRPARQWSSTTERSGPRAA